MGAKCCTLEKERPNTGVAYDRKSCVCGSPYVPANALFCSRCGHKRHDGCEEVGVAEDRLIAWLRRRNGVDCDFGEVFVELFGDRRGVNEDRFEQVLRTHGYKSDARATFARLDRHGKTGHVGATELETLQVEVEEKEREGLKHLRDFLKAHFSCPSQAFREMGKGEGDELSMIEFVESMKRLGFIAEDPAQLFNFLDKDYSGEISFCEFKSLLKGNAKKRIGGTSPKSSPRSPKAASPRGGAGHNKHHHS